MEPRISIITLGVADLKKSAKFYKDLGFPTEGVKGTFIMFQLKGTTLALFPKKSLAEDAKVAESGNGFSGITLAHNVKTVEKVDKIMEKVEKIGAKITDPAHKRDWGGYSGYFEDPDGYIWEVAWNPHSPELAE